MVSNSQVIGSINAEQKAAWQIIPQRQVLKQHPSMILLTTFAQTLN